MMTTTTGNKRRMALSMLPEEMEMEVLLRLPVKSILRFSAVCRRWAALLSSKEFCSLWAKITESRTTEPAAQLLFLSLPPRTDERRSNEVRSGDGRRLLTINAVRGPYPGRDGIALAPCSGIILLYDPLSPSGSYHIFNAATRAAAELPPPTPSQEGLPSSAGLGFDARTKEHKVVRLFCSNGRPACEVLALGRRSDRRWRPTSFAATDGGVVLTTLVEAALFTAVWYKTTPVFADGFLHWFVNPTTCMPAAVLSFSVADETFSSSWVRPPPFDWDVSGRAHHLTVLDGKLCMVRDLRDDPAGLLDIWSYGGAAGWSLEHRIDLAVKPLHGRVVGGSVGKRKVIFIATSSCKVVAYDPMSGTLETILQFAEETSPLHYARDALTKVCLFKESLTRVH